jgi:hypothetical protein
MSLTVACVWVNGHVPFGVEYVDKLRTMVERHLAREHRFVCFTDRPKQLARDMDHIRIDTPPAGIKGWWSKLELFNREAGLTGRVLYLDLDTLVVDALDPIVDFPSPFALAPHAGTFNGKDGLLVIKKFNSSVMVWDAGCNHDLYDNFTPAIARTLWGDQDWIGTVCPNAAAMPAEWFPRLSEVVGTWPAMEPDAKVVLCKKPKNAEAVKTLRGFAEVWG